MVLAEAGEDAVMYTEDGQYAANLEKAVSLPPEPIASAFTTTEKRATPNTATIATLCDLLGCSPTQVVKNVLYQAVYDTGITVLVLVSIRGDRDVNDTKLTNELTRRAADYDATTLIALEVPDTEAQAKWAAKPLPLGYIAPDLADDYIAGSKTVAPKFLRLADNTVTALKNFVSGANDTGYHTVGANWGETYTLPDTLDLDTAMVGDRAVHDPNQTLHTARGIEAGHIFQLGTKYSAALGATFTDEDGKNKPLVMGCYGIGVSRLAQSAVEQSHDRNGIIWPVAIAPYHAVVVVPNINTEEQMAIGTQLYETLNAAGIETLLDDRKERAGVKFKDAELIGIPYRVVTGRSIEAGNVEIVERATGEAQEVAIENVTEFLQAKIKAAIA
jgi:prolyl-tRNA synthetase